MFGVLFLLFRILAGFGFSVRVHGIALESMEIRSAVLRLKMDEDKRARAHTHFVHRISIWLFGYWTKAVRAYKNTHTQFNWFPHGRRYMHWLMNLCARCIRRFGFHFFHLLRPASGRAFGMRNQTERARRETEAKRKRTNRARCENKRQTQVDWF